MGNGHVKLRRNELTHAPEMSMRMVYSELAILIAGILMLNQECTPCLVVEHCNKAFISIPVRSVTPKGVLS
jgi:hypothetical protein